MNLSRYSINQLHFVFIALALLFSAWINYIQHGWINGDCVIYFEAARLFSLGEWKAGLDIWGWPFFSLLIAGIHKTSGLSIQFSAQILNTILFGIATASFLQLIREAGGKKAALVSGGLILLGSQYIVGDILSMLLRDQGFWAFFLTSLVFLVRYAKAFRISDALLWQVSIMLATLFRIEGIIYLALLPFTLLVITPSRIKLKALLHAHSLNILAGIGLLTSMLILGLKTTELGRLQEVFTLDIYQQLTQKLFTQADIMAEFVLGDYLDEFAVSSLLIAFAFIMIMKIFSATGIINTILSILAIIVKPALIAKPAKTILNVAILISLLNMFLIITKVFVLSGRYVIAMSLILMVYTAFYMAYLFERYQIGWPANKIGRGILWIIPASLLIGLISNLLPKPTGFNHEQEAISWLKAHNINNQEVFFDSARLRYYAGAPYIGTGGNYVLNAVRNQEPITTSYVVTGNSKKHPEHQALFEENYANYKEVARFNGPKSKKSTIIYQSIP